MNQCTGTSVIASCAYASALQVALGPFRCNLLALWQCHVSCLRVLSTLAMCLILCDTNMTPCAGDQQRVHSGACCHARHGMPAGERYSRGSHNGAADQAPRAAGSADATNVERERRGTSHQPRGAHEDEPWRGVPHVCSTLRACIRSCIVLLLDSPRGPSGTDVQWTDFIARVYRSS